MMGSGAGGETSGRGRGCTSLELGRTEVQPDRLPTWIALTGRCASGAPDSRVRSA